MGPEDLPWAVLRGTSPSESVSSTYSGLEPQTRPGTSRRRAAWLGTVGRSSRAPGTGPVLRAVLLPRWRFKYYYRD